MKIRCGFALPFVVGSSLCGCASIMEGTTQEIMVKTEPPGANCQLTRNGENIGTVASTPGSIVVKKRKYDISVTCAKENYQTATVSNKSDAAAWAAGNVIFVPAGAFIGWGIDSITGADNKYTAEMTITLEPEIAASQPEQAAPAATVATSHED